MLHIFKSAKIKFMFPFFILATESLSEGELIHSFTFGKRLTIGQLIIKIAKLSINLKEFSFQITHANIIQK